MIRGRKIGCPFGLDIPEGCMCAGSSVKFMSRIDKLKGDELTVVCDENYDIMLTAEEPFGCIYADSIIESKGVVDCKFDPENDFIPAGNVGLNGSPYYPHLYSGNVSEKITNEYPARNYSDNNHDNPYFALFSLFQ